MSRCHAYPPGYRHIGPRAAMELPGRYAWQRDTRHAVTFILHVFCTFSSIVILIETNETCWAIRQLDCLKYAYTHRRRADVLLIIMTSSCSRSQSQKDCLSEFHRSQRLSHCVCASVCFRYSLQPFLADLQLPVGLFSPYQQVQSPNP